MLFNARMLITKGHPFLLFQRYPTDPALGLEHVHEWNDPARRGLIWYTCDQKGCKSAWGKSFEMCAHLIGNKNKHNRNYLANRGVFDAMGMTNDKLLVSDAVEAPVTTTNR